MWYLSRNIKIFHSIDMRLYNVLILVFLDIEYITFGCCAVLALKVREFIYLIMTQLLVARKYRPYSGFRFNTCRTGTSTSRFGSMEVQL